ncbi:MAG: ArsR/SmtB family transcription factor [Geodermatophilaceae bacterium]
MTIGQLATLGRLVGNDTRAQLLTVLMGGRAHTGGELARRAGVSPSTASEHLSALLDAGMLTVEAQGRHRYYRLADSDIAELLELMGGSAPAPVTGASRSPAPDALTFARSCYDHLAGMLAVRLYDAMAASDLLTVTDHKPVLTPGGSAVLAEMGIDAAALAHGRRPLTRHCLDWSERRHHLAGAVGAALLESMLGRRWLVAGQQPRALRVTRAGYHGIERTFGFDPHRVEAHRVDPAADGNGLDA